MKQRYAVLSKQPVLLGRLFNAIQTELIEKVDFLDIAYGKAERISVTTADGQLEYIPAIYKQGNDYENLMPDDKRGNYSFFVLEGSQEYEHAKGRGGRLHGNCSLIVWLDQRTMSNTWCKEYAENVLLSALSDLNLTDGHLNVVSVDERVDSVFEGFSIRDVDNRFLTYPYCGFKFNCEFSIRQNCSEL